MVWPVVRGTIASDFYLFIYFFNSRKIEFKIKNKKQVPNQLGLWENTRKLVLRTNSQKHLENRF